MITVNHRLRMLSLFLITILGYGFYNFYLPITDPVESNYVLSAITMLDHNSWISPMIYNQVWYDKPPLTYWALMICYKFFGVSDFTSRIPNTLMAGLNVVMMYHIVYKIKQSPLAAIASAIILMSTIQFWYISHAVVTDGILFFAALGTFGYAYLALDQMSSSHMVKAYAFSAVGILAKGPIALLLPGLILILFVVAQLIPRRNDMHPRLIDYGKILFTPLGLITVLIIACPWYIAMYTYHSQDFINGFLGLQNVGRALISEHPKYNVWYYYFAIIPIALLPWTPIIIYRLRHFNWKDSFQQFGALWFVTIVLFYTLVATKYLTYTLPAIIPLIMWAGIGMAELWQSKQTKLIRNVVWIPVLAVCFILLIGTNYDDTLTPFPLLIAIILIGLVFMMTRHQKTINCQLHRLTAILVIMYTAVTITVVPILVAQSGLQFVPYIKHQPVYVYGTYYTSIVYYTKSLPTQVFVRSTDDQKWIEGKNLMPTITKDEFLDRILVNDEATVIVPNKYEEDFKLSPIAYFMSEVGSTKAGKVYELKKTITF